MCGMAHLAEKIRLGRGNTPGAAASARLRMSPRAGATGRDRTIIPCFEEKFASQRRHSAQLLRPGPGLFGEIQEDTVISIEIIQARGEGIGPEGWLDRRRA